MEIALRLTSVHNHSREFTANGPRTVKFIETKSGNFIVKIFTGWSSRSSEIAELREFSNKAQALTFIAEKLGATTIHLNMYSVAGIDEHEKTSRNWMVRRPDGALCGGRWASESDAQDFCDRYNGAQSYGK